MHEHEGTDSIALQATFDLESSHFVAWAGNGCGAQSWITCTAQNMQNATQNPDTFRIIHTRCLAYLASTGPGSCVFHAGYGGEGTLTNPPLVIAFIYSSTDAGTDTAYSGSVRRAERRAPKYTSLCNTTGAAEQDI